MIASDYYQPSFGYCYTCNVLFFYYGHQHRYTTGTASSYLPTPNKTVYLTKKQAVYYATKAAKEALKIKTLAERKKRLRALAREACQPKSNIKPLVLPATNFITYCLRGKPNKHRSRQLRLYLHAYSRVV